MAGTQAQGGGLWSPPTVTYSADTHKLLKEMMQESKLTNFQQRHLEKSLRGGSSLPVRCPPTSSVKKKPVSAPKPKSKSLNPRNYSSSVRSKEQIEATGAYERPDYSPMANQRGRDNENMKLKLANMMAFGEDIDPTQKKKQPRPARSEREVRIDRFDEIQAEIKERKDFLDDMEGLGQGDKYRTIIETEISQLIREMEVIDKKKSIELEKMIAADEQRRGAKS